MSKNKAEPSLLIGKTISPDKLSSRRAALGAPKLRECHGRQPAPSLLLCVVTVARTCSRAAPGGVGLRLGMMALRRGLGRRQIKLPRLQVPRLLLLVLLLLLLLVLLLLL